MMTAPDTRPSLLLRLKDARNQAAWAEFLAIYQPLIFRVIRSNGLQDADANEVTQDVLLAVSKAIGRWNADPARGSFRGWLARITRNLVINFLIRRDRHPRGTGDSDFMQWLNEVPDPRSQASQVFDAEYRRRLFHLAALNIQRDISEVSWDAFRMTAIEQRDIVEVARSLKMTTGAIYVARSRVMKRMRECVEQLQKDDE